jgi:hypothetical protein
MLRLIELGTKNWQTASRILAIAYDDCLTKEQRDRVAKSYEERFREFPDTRHPFLEFGRKMNNSFEESFFPPFENHVKHHESDSKPVNSEPYCIICPLIGKTRTRNWVSENYGRVAHSQDAA